MSFGVRSGGIFPPRFNVAIHILAWLAKKDGVCSSNEIASEVKGHATFLRRVLAPLVQAGIVHAREGRVGGYALAKPADRISLGEVYTALKGAVPPDDDAAGDEPQPEKHGERLDWLLGEILGQAEERVVRFLRSVTIADLARSLET